MIPEIGFLKKVYIFSSLNDDELEALAQIITPREFEPGQVILQEGDLGSCMYLAAEGDLQVHKSLTMKFGEDDFRETAKTLTVMRAEDHAVIGEMSLITEDKRSATVTALTKCTLYEISRGGFLDLAGKLPEFGFKVTFRIAEILSQRLKKSGEDVVRLTTALSIALS